MPTKKRVEKIKRVLSLRQPDLRLVLEDVTNTHNASAVVRTCDAAGILYVDIISSRKDTFIINEAVSTRAEKWLQFCFYSSTGECIDYLKGEGFKIAVTSLYSDSLSYTLLDYNQPLAIIFGNESEGISNEARKRADYIIKIPIIGMVQSLNLSVSVGVILYEAVNQRQKRGYFNKTHLSLEKLQIYQKKWLTSPAKKSKK